MNRNEELQLCSLLRSLPQEILPFDIFLEIARLVVLPIIELVCLRRRDEIIEILLLQRSPGDPLWPNALHSPGSVLRIYDNSFDDAISRMLQEELAELKISKPVFVKNLFNVNERGKESAQIYLAKVLEDPKVGQFYNVEELPPNVMLSQIKFIEEAVKYFKNSYEKTYN